MLARWYAPFRSIVFLCAAVAASLPCLPQEFDLDRDRVPMAELHGLARFHTGDDPKWADPAFDDSSWELLKADANWDSQGHPHYSGMAWYRFKLHYPAQHRALALYIPQIRTCYEVYADGVKVGGMGGMPPHTVVDYNLRQVVNLPSQPTGHAGTIEVAIRVWQWPHWALYYEGGIINTMRYGDADMLRDWKNLHYEDTYWSLSASNFEFAMFLLAGVGCLLLYCLRRSEPVYLWFGLANLLAGVSTMATVSRNFYSFPLLPLEACIHESYVLGLAATLEFVRQLRGERRDRMYWAVIIVLALDMLLTIPGDLEWLSVGVWNALDTILALPYYACILLILGRGMRKGDLDSRLIFFPFAAYYLAEITLDTVWTLYAFGFTQVGKLLQWMYAMTNWPFPISLPDIAGVLQLLAIFTILLMRFARSRRDEERLKGELEAARVVQQVLIPEETPLVPGFTIASVYKPAGQVGGDFFQILPLKGGGVLAVIGDVSGKGMPAAMTVSLLVGTVRTLAHYTESPGEILAAMNQRMMGRQQGGFTTCLVLRADPDGQLTVANAGHIAPYLDGHELTIENGLPLGLDAEAAYGESEFFLQQDKQLALVTDGVVEARGGAGDLFGFDRTAALSNEPAETIMEAAQAFGQDDDITVLTLSRCSAAA